jgi:TonB family protein
MTFRPALPAVLLVLLSAPLHTRAAAPVAHCLTVPEQPAVQRADRCRKASAAARPSARSPVKLAALSDHELDVAPPLTDEEARLALDRDLSLKVGKYMREGDYPDEARRWRWSGTALVEVLLSAEGFVQQVLLSRSSGFRVLDEQALEVVRRVPKVYLPAQLRRRPHRALVPIDFRFQEL